MISPLHLNELANKLVKDMPHELGFALVVFDVNDGLRDYQYMSNCERSDMLPTFEALVAKWKNEIQESKKQIKEPGQYPSS